jgi:hypothetical protein
VLYFPVLDLSGHFFSCMSYVLDCWGCTLCAFNEFALLIYIKMQIFGNFKNLATKYSFYIDVQMLYYYLCFIDVADLHNCRLELCGWYDFNFIVGFDLHVLFSFHTFSYLL